MSQIKNYALIGDLHTAALVSNKGSIDWLCFPHFDSPSIFAKLLDKKNGGEFSIISKGYKSFSEYEKRTAIVKTTFSNKNKKLVLKDFMVPKLVKKTNSHYLVRKFKSYKGSHNLRFIYAPLLEYGKITPIIKKERSTLVVEIGEEFLILHLPSNSKLKKINNGYEIFVSVKKGEMKEFVLEYFKKVKRKYKISGLEMRTKKFWNNWISKGNFVDFCKEQMIRSAITLKLMQYYPTGALIASPTTSLPEAIKGERNWDYRYTWIRDATSTLFAFYILGYRDEARKFFSYIEKTAKECRESNMEIRPLYTIYGKLPPKEDTLEHLKGYKNSKPVRIGNAARSQFQLDSYGSLIDSYYFMISKKLRVTKGTREMIIELVKSIEKNWKKKDSGIWEFRDKKEHYTFSKVMAWVGVNRALRLCKKLKVLANERKKIEKLEKEIKDWIWKNCFDKKKEIFLQYKGAKNTDATNLLFVPLQFLDKHDTLTYRIIKNTTKELSKKEIFIYRYQNSDGLKGREGAFILCSFWFISSLAVIEKVSQAESLFSMAEKMLSNYGLLSEEINPNNLKFQGNHPQALSHMGHIMAAHYINKYKK